MRKIPKKESLDVEFKSDQMRLKDSILVEAAVGLSNSIGGTIYLGVEDDGTVTGLHRDHKDPLGLTAMIANKTSPPVNAAAEIIQEDGQDVMDIQIPVSHVLVSTSDGKVLRRRLKLDGTPETTPIYPHEYTSRLSSLGALDFSAQVVPDAKRSDFDPLQMVRIRRLIASYNGDRLLLELTDEELEKALGMVKTINNEEVPTVAGLLMLGRRESIERFLPTAKASFQVLDGERVVINQMMTAPIPELFETFLERFNNQVEEQETMVGAYRLGIPDFDVQAFREALMNAFCHRDYAMMGEIRVLIDEEGLTINSPGGFMEGISAQTLLTAAPMGRNPLISDILKRIGLTERTGRGIDKIYTGSWQYGKNDPDYSETTSSRVTLFIPRSKPDIPFASAIALTRSQGRAPSTFGLMILNLLRKKPGLDSEEIADKTGFSQARTERQLEILSDNQLIRQSDGRYFLTILPSSEPAKPVDMEKEVLRLFDSNANLQRKQIAEALQLSSGQAFRILKKLTEQNKLVLVKNGNRSYYHLP